MYSPQLARAVAGPDRKPDSTANANPTANLKLPSHATEDINQLKDAVTCE
jgi:hypothetical protein